MVILKTIRKIYENINNGNDFNSHFKSQAAEKNRSKQKEKKTIYSIHSFAANLCMGEYKLNAMRFFFIVLKTISWSF